ncbi:MAG TPA: hypothetical protein VN578_14600 [Candidatus Binatia bacterium]|nr:hypothetical protein [Candidatus Binatia bacterium]
MTPSRPWPASISVFLLAARLAQAAPSITAVPAGNQGFDVYADGALVAPIRLAANGAIMADNVVSNAAGITLSGLRAQDSLAVTFAADDFVSISVPPPPAGTNAPTGWQPIVRFKLTPANFNTNHWLAMLPDGPAPFHFLVCSMPTAQVWHQRGWLNATPFADPFPLLQDVHTGSPEISCLWNRNWSYICPLGGHPIPMIGLWDPAAGLYVGYDFQGARATDQSERFIATAYCWSQSGLTNFIALAYPYGGLRYGQQVYPQGGEVLASWFNLQIDTDLAPTEDPNERFHTRLFAQYTNTLPRVPAMNDLLWIPGQARLSDFSGPIGLGLYGPGGETTFYPAGTLLLQSWGGHIEMPIDTAVRRGDLATLNAGRGQLESLLTNYAISFMAGGDSCLYWQKPLTGAWLTNWGGPAVTTLHNSEGWFPARVLVELYRYDRTNNQVRPSYLPAIDGLFNWARHLVWSRNEFADVPSSPFAIGSTLCSAFLLDYYFTFRGDPQRGTNATLALHLADTITWRYLHPWAMDSDRFDGALDSAFLAEPNSGRDWAGLGCANEVNWNIDSLTQVYVHTGDPRMRYYLRGMLQRWPVLYQPNYEDSLAQYNTSEALTEGLGVFDGSGPGRGLRYPYGFSPSLPLNEPVGSSTMRVVAGAQACIAFDKNGMTSDVADYRTGGDGSCTFRIVSSNSTVFDVTFSYPFFDIHASTVTRVRNGVTNVLGIGQVERPLQSPSSFYFSQLQNGDIITIGTVPANAPIINFDTSLVYSPTNVVAATNGLFTTLPLPANTNLVQDWNNLSSFAGIVPGRHWNYGIPAQQGLQALNNVAPVSAPGAGVLLVTYSPPVAQTLTAAPNLLLDNGTNLPLSGNPVLAWRAWPIIFTQKVLMDYAVVPAGRTLAQVNPNGTLVMGLTAFTGTQTDWLPFQATLAAASSNFVQQETQELAVLALQASYALLPTGKIALLPLNTAGPGANFAAATGLRKKWDALTETQFVDTNTFNPARYPLAFYLGSENYVKTVLTNGDGKAAITKYLAGGGTLVLLATGPYPFYYGYGPADAAGPADPLLPTYGMSLQGFEQAPAGIFMQLYTNQTILHSVPQQFAFPPGDPRLRALIGSSVSTLNRYQPFLKALDGQGTYYGDAVLFIAFGTGPAKGGRILYVWDTLLSGPQGQSIMIDTVTWILNAVLRPPPARFDSIQMPDPTHVLLSFSATSNLDYVLQYQNTLGSGAWATWLDCLSAPTNRSLRLTLPLTGTSRFYRLSVGP